MKLISAAFLLGSASTTCPTIKTSWFVDADCTKPMKVPPTEGMDFENSNMVEEAWNNAMNACIDYGEEFVGMACSYVGYTAAIYTDANCTEGRTIREDATWTSWDDLFYSGCLAGSDADTYFSWTIEW